MKKSIKAGDKVWLKMPYIDDSMEVWGEVVKINKKSIRCFSDVRGCEGNYSVKNVRARG